MRFVADASAVLAFIKREPARADLFDCLAESVIAPINLAEVASSLTAFNADDGVRAIIKKMAPLVADFGVDLAVEAGLLRRMTKGTRISLADLSCMALARSLNVPALTGDREWMAIANFAGVELALIR